MLDLCRCGLAPIRLLLGLAFLCALCSGQSWRLQNSGTTESLRGLSVLTHDTAWASGTHGTVLKTTNGGNTWQALTVPGAEAVDFRDIHAFSPTHVLVLSIGPGEQSRIYRTRDGGAHWNMVFRNPDAKGFFDAFAFWDDKRGILMGDPVDGRFAIFTTADGGDTWTRQSPPPALDKEGAFAASGTCIAVGPNGAAWFATGGPGAGRVFRSTDYGVAWNVTATPIRNDGEAAGIFSLEFRDGRNGIAVGGDYKSPTAVRGNIILSSDGGMHWRASTGAAPAGYRSGLTFVKERRIWIAVGTSGSEWASEDARQWRPIGSEPPGGTNGLALNAVAGSSLDAVWAVGPKGTIAKLEWSMPSSEAPSAPANKPISKKR